MYRHNIYGAQAGNKIGVYSLTRIRKSKIMLHSLHIRAFSTKEEEKEGISAQIKENHRNHTIMQIAQNDVGSCLVALTFKDEKLGLFDELFVHFKAISLSFSLTPMSLLCFSKERHRFCANTGSAVYRESLTRKEKAFQSTAQSRPLV